ncbi:MAG: TIR domain-containing protein, partial [Bryobacterales bacterium]|nr:TIR domain-containing protein [Bryobacterales bacterium]
MANVFISHAYTDLPLAQAIEKQLLDKGHTSRIPLGAAVAGTWRAKYARALAAADVLVVLVTVDSLNSKNVLGEIGAGRVLEQLKGLIMLPVLYDDMGIPPFLSDIYCFRLRGPESVDALVDELDKVIVDNVNLTPRVFISHRHKDAPVASALTSLLEQAFHVQSSDIRCTSVQPYMLT